MRILFLTMQFGDGYFQGTERYLERLMRGLVERGHTVRVLAGDPKNQNPPQNEALGTINTAGWMAVVGNAEHELASELDDFCPDVIHVLNPAHVGLGIGQLAKQRDIPIIITTMDYWWVCPTHTLMRGHGQVCDGSKPWQECARCIASRHANPIGRSLSSLPVIAETVSSLALKLAAKRNGVSQAEFGLWQTREKQIGEVLRGAHGVIFPAAATEDIIGNAFPGIRSVRIPYGIDPHWFETTRSKPLQADPQSVRIGYAGALESHKGVHHILEGVKKLGWTQAQIQIAGSGNESYLQQLRKLAKGLRVEFLGCLTPDEMRDFFARSDVLLVPSIWPENLPIVTLEAAASGVPVLASDVAGHREHIAAEALFTPNSSDALANMLQNWIGHHRIPPVPDRPILVDEMVDRTLDVYTHGVDRITPND